MFQQTDACAKAQQSFDHAEGLQAAVAEAEKALLLTTEKDWVRLSAEMRKQVTAFPVKLVFEDRETVRRIIKGN